MGTSASINRKLPSDTTSRRLDKQSPLLAIPRTLFQQLAILPEKYRDIIEPYELNNICQIAIISNQQPEQQHTRLSMAKFAAGSNDDLQSLSIQTASQKMKGTQDNTIEVSDPAPHEIHLADKEGYTALFFAVQGNDTSLAGQLLNQGADPNTVLAKTGCSVLMKAIQLHSIEMAEILLTKGANPNFSRLSDPENGPTPLIVAVANEQDAIVRLLLTHGADPTMAVNNQITPLLQAVLQGSKQCILALAEEGVDVNFKVQESQVSALYIAVVKKNLEICQILLKHGANPNDEDERGINILGQALCHSGEHLGIARALLFARPPPSGPPPHRRHCRRRRRSFPGGGGGGAADPDRPSGWAGGAPLHAVAAAAGRGAAALLLLESGANPAQTNVFGQNSMHVAAATNNLTFLHLCEEYGHAELFALKSKAGWNCLHFAAYYGHLKAVKYLTPKINVSETDTNDRTASQLAQSCGHYKIAYILKDKELTSKNSLYDIYQASKVVLVENLTSLRKSRRDIKQSTHFANKASQHLSKVSLEHVFFLKKEGLIAAGKLPTFEQCMSNDWLIQASDIKLSGNSSGGGSGGGGEGVLFVSHRWAGPGQPDNPQGHQWAALCAFLAPGAPGANLSLLWLDCACVAQRQQNGGPSFAHQVANIPTSIFAAAACLVLPRVDVAGPECWSVEERTAGATARFGGQPLEVTNLADYLGRGWCLMELCAAFLAGARCHLAFSVQGRPFFQPLFGTNENHQGTIGIASSFHSVSNVGDGDCDKALDSGGGWKPAPLLLGLAEQVHYARAHAISNEFLLELPGVAEDWPGQAGDQRLLQAAMDRFWKVRDPTPVLNYTFKALAECQYQEEGPGDSCAPSPMVERLLQFRLGQVDISQDRTSVMVAGRRAGGGTGVSTALTPSPPEAEVLLGAGYGCKGIGNGKGLVAEQSGLDPHQPKSPRDETFGSRKEGGEEEEGGRQNTAAVVVERTTDINCYQTSKNSSCFNNARKQQKQFTYLQRLQDSLGFCTFQEDKILVMNVLLVIAMFSTQQQQV